MTCTFYSWRSLYRVWVKNPTRRTTWKTWT